MLSLLKQPSIIPATPLSSIPCRANLQAEQLAVLMDEAAVVSGSARIVTDQAELQAAADENDEEEQPMAAEVR